MIKKDTVDILEKVYWGGGSVVMALDDEPITMFKMNPCSKFEDGTLNFLSIVGLEYGLQALSEIGIDHITRHVTVLTRYLYTQMSQLRHHNGAPVVEIYGKHNMTSSSSSNDHGNDVQGSILSFNLLSSTGTYIGYNQVGGLAASHNIHIRTGCHCNPGACFHYLNLQTDEVEHYFKDKGSCGSGKELTEDGKPLGSIRLSIGYLTTFEDIKIWLEFLHRFYIHH